jgi:hypothetical protein
MRAPALAELHEIFLGQAGSALELFAGKHYRCDTANAELRKDDSLAYKITRISLVPLSAVQQAEAIKMIRSGEKSQIEIAGILGPFRSRRLRN